MTNTGDWRYDWLHNRFRADYLNVFPNVSPNTVYYAVLSILFSRSQGTKSNETQLWRAYESKFYVFHWTGGFCYWYNYQNLSILRPDAFSHAKANHTGRKRVNGRWADGFSSGDFNMDQDVDTNFPLRSHSGAGDEGYLETNFFDVLPGIQPDALYALDVSKCPEKKERGRSEPFLARLAQVAGVR